ncbi:MAG: HNH endonuclease [Mycobacteriales bacterium]
MPSTSHVLLDELDVRRCAMAYLAEAMESSGGVVTRAQLEAFSYGGEQLKLIDQSRGIRNPRQLAATLSILSQPKGPYDDVETADGLLRYANRDGDPDSGDNRKLRRAAELGLPLVLLQGIAAGVFVPTFPVYVVADDPVGRYVEIAVDENLRYLAGATPTADTREYAERLTRLRLHQPVFRARVLRAYEQACAICRLRHAAYDRGIVGVRADYVVAVRPDVLLEIDGPMLRHGIQDVQGWTLELPKRVADRPDRELLAARWETFSR